MCNYLNVDFSKYLELTKLKDKYNSLSDERKKVSSFYNLIISDKEFRNIYLLMFSFFIIENVEFNDKTNEFDIWENQDHINDNGKTEKRKTIIGKINNSNFDSIRNILLQVNCMKSTRKDDEPVKYKNEFAKKLAERMTKTNQKKLGNQMSFGKMVSKYCADNKNGINMLNVHNLTIYQFFDQWNEHNNIRQCNIQDMIYANTVNFSDLKTYDSQLWLK
jgi:hypothetical protein